MNLLIRTKLVITERLATCKENEVQRNLECFEQAAVHYDAHITPTEKTEEIILLAPLVTALEVGVMLIRL